MPEWGREMLSLAKLQTTGKLYSFCNFMAGIDWRMPDNQFSEKELILKVVMFYYVVFQGVNLPLHYSFLKPTSMSINFSWMGGIFTQHWMPCIVGGIAQTFSRKIFNWLNKNFPYSLYKTYLIQGNWVPLITGGRLCLIFCKLTSIKVELSLIKYVLKQIILAFIWIFFPFVFPWVKLKTNFMIKFHK